MDIVDNLHELTYKLLKQCEENTTHIKELVDIIKNVNSLGFKTKNGITETGIETNIDIDIDIETNIGIETDIETGIETITKEVDIKDIEETDSSYDVNIARRVELHKELGSFIKPLDYPTITPLLKLNNRQRDILLLKIFKESLFYVKKILQIDESDTLFKLKVKEESDRLLNVWMESN